MVCVGKIAGAHGVRGQVRIASYTDDPADIGSYGPLQDESGKTQFTVTVTGMSKGQVVATIGGINDRSAAEALRGVSLFVSRSSLPPADEDEFYFEDLVGLRAKTVSGKDLGTVIAVEDFGAGPLLEVGKPRAKSAYVPFTLEIVPKVDLAKKLVVIDPPPGLLEPVPEEDGDEH